MKKPFLYIFVCIVIFTAPRVFAQTSSNADFNPFPQMEQDQNSADDQAAPAPQQENDDTWPPVNSETRMNREGGND